MTTDAFARHTVEAAVLADEERIIWIDHPENHCYVRETVLSIPRRQQRPGSSRVPGRLVAYAVLQATAPGYGSGRFRRRVWWLASHDPYPGGGAPWEGVDPQSIRAKHWSRNPRTPGPRPWAPW